MGVIKPSFQRRRLAKISSQTDQRHSFVAIANISQVLITSVAAPIVNKYHFVRIAEAVHDLDDGLVQRPDVFFFIKKRDDNRKINRRAGKLSKTFFFHDGSLSSR